MPAETEPTLLYLSRADVIRVGGDEPSLYMEAVERALVLHARGKVVQPLKAYLRSAAPGVHMADRIIAMPARIEGPKPIAGLKWIGSKHDNREEFGLERASALMILNDPETHYPIAILEGGLISGMRTAAVTVLAARSLARPAFSQVACLGCGTIGRMHLLSMLHEFPHITSIHLFDVDITQSTRLETAIMEEYDNVTVTLAKDCRTAVECGDVVIVCTVAETPYIAYEWLHPGIFISNISLMDVQPDVFLGADKVVVDDWSQCNREGKVINQLVREGQFDRESVHAELGHILAGDVPGREREDEVILLNPMGIAVEDVVCAQMIYERARSLGIGLELKLY